MELADLQKDVIKNTAEIQATKDSFKMSIDRLEEKITDLKEDVNKGFADVNQRFDAFEKSVDIKIEDRISSNTKDRILNLIKFCVVAVVIPITVSVVAKIIVNSL